jgi:hypothetical protein
VNVTKWLRGDVSASPHRSYVRIWIERPGVNAEVYLTRAQARELRDGLTWILRPSSGTSTE